MYSVNLSDEQRCELNERTHGRGLSAHTRDRLEMVRLSDAGWSVPKIARHLCRNEKTVRYWIKAYASDGFDALGNKKHLGRKSALTVEMLSGVRQEIKKGERTFTSGQLGDWIERQYGVALSEGRLRLHLKRAGLSWQRTSRNLRHKQDPEAVAASRAGLRILEKGGMRD